VQAVLAALSSLQQLTCLSLCGIHEGSEVPRSTWASLLPHLIHLRVLVVSKLLLEGGLAPEVPQLPQLKCLYVMYNAPANWSPAATCAEVAPHLEVLSKCSSLKAVLCGAVPRCAMSGTPIPQFIYVHVHQGRLHLSDWYKWRDAAEEGRVVCPQACPHLPGVLELQQQEPADG
jgi:hypothetical protein